ncbi:hypothetical protein PIROE2DRAFT_61160 [Piromyces sp. E2]|nr:hypothetical protein PIROE2DRAFT_61160 [Piromyces sp. E2]|eukprot:OUM63628.1 hypothetical protein PIROE2DRAFT_61160 [Piromyces sp. E2]
MKSPKEGNKKDCNGKESFDKNNISNSSDNNNDSILSEMNGNGYNNGIINCINKVIEKKESEKDNYDNENKNSKNTEINLTKMEKEYSSLNENENENKKNEENDTHNDCNISIEKSNNTNNIIDNENTKTINNIFNECNTKEDICIDRMGNDNIHNDIEGCIVGEGVLKEKIEDNMDKDNMDKDDMDKDDMDKDDIDKDNMNKNDIKENNMDKNDMDMDDIEKDKIKIDDLKENDMVIEDIEKDIMEEDDIENDIMKIDDLKDNDMENKVETNLSTYDKCNIYFIISCSLLSSIDSIEIIPEKRKNIKIINNELIDIKVKEDTFLTFNKYENISLLNIYLYKANIEILKGNLKSSFKIKLKYNEKNVITKNSYVIDNDHYLFIYSQNFEYEHWYDDWMKKDDLKYLNKTYNISYLQKFSIYKSYLENSDQKDDVIPILLNETLKIICHLKIINLEFILLYLVAVYDTTQNYMCILKMFDPSSSHLFINLEEKK